MEEFARLVELMETLRSDEGCSWDKKQTTDSFKTFLLEEVYEVIDAIEKQLLHLKADEKHIVKEEF